ncbi:MAG: hypothetical protein RLZZ630_172 [Bacteroidota bacterium]|jgi:signal transduction histidine kinase
MGFRQRALILAAVALASWAALFLQGSSYPLPPADSREIHQAVEQCRNLTQEVESLTIRLESGLREPVFSEWRFSDMLEREKQIPRTSVLVFEKGLPVFWNNSEVLPETILISTYRTGRCTQLGNGWFYIVRKDIGDRILLVMLKIYTGYALQNQYLVNGFHPFLGLESSWSPVATDANVEGSTSLQDHHGSVMMEIVPEPAVHGGASRTGDAWFVVLLASLLLLMMDAVSHFGRPMGGVVVTIAWVVRIWTDLNGWPPFIAGLDLFNPVYYASGTLMNSLGDLLITVGIILLSMLFLHKLTGQGVTASASKREVWLAAFGMGATTVLSIVVHGLLTGLVLNSQIAFDIRDFFSLNSYTIAGLTGLLVLLIALYLATDATARFLSPAYHKGWLSFLFLWLFPQGVAIALWKYQPDYFHGMPYSLTAWFLLQALLIASLIRREKERTIWSFNVSVPLLLMLAIYSAQALHELNAKREQDKRMLFAQKLDSERDRIAEFLLDRITDNISKDSVIGRFLSGPAPGINQLTEALNEAGAHIQRNHLGGYLSRYESSFRFFDQNDKPINTSGDPSWNIDVLRKRSVEGRMPVAFHNEEGQPGYSMLIPVMYRSLPAGTLSIVLTNRTGRLDERRLPALLLSDQLETETSRRGYSYALYKQGKLVSQQGDFNYYQTDAPYRVPKSDAGEMVFAGGDGVQHLFYRQGDRLVIVSAPDYGWTGWITLFSYLFTFFGITFFSAITLRHIVLRGFRFSPSLRNRLQVGVLTMVTFTLLLLGAATIAFFVRNYREMQVQHLYERLEELQNMTGEIVGNLNNLTGEGEENTRFALERVASSANAGFNIFGRDGLLFYTSQPGIYQQGLQAPLMDRNALRALTVGQQTVFDQTERVGELDYLSAYEPVRNAQNDIIGYLNIPFYDRETELKQDISDFLVALINLYVFLFSVALLIAFAISARITAPLQLLQENLRETRLGQLKPLEWKSRDEFGELIDSYNRMLDQLQRSAEKLASSEREGAWREMARQVAHEIKNPLTPMKLGIQHLQRSLQEDSPDRPERINRICNTLVEQIDTLAGIAGAFSDFARLPGPEMETLNLIPILENTIALYGNDQGTGISLGAHPDTCMVSGDKDQLLRIFGNLVKNSLQAIPENRPGQINLSVIDGSDFITIAIADNGIGIPVEQQKQMFIPNFTTKTGGTGLGLVMVKAMTEGMGGDVRFETEVGKGTTFFIRLPKAKVVRIEKPNQVFS